MKKRRRFDESKITICEIVIKIGLKNWKII